MDENKPTMGQRICNIFKKITVEPVALFYLIGNILAGTASQTLTLDKTCRVNLNLSEAICNAVRYQNTDNNTENERIVQEYVVSYIAYKSIITATLPCILLVFAGGWMDLTGRRKIIMLLSVSAEIIVQISNMINVIFFHQLKVEVLIFSDAVLSNIFGAWPLLFLVLFSYIVDITTEEERTYRLGLVSFCLYIGLPIGVALSGIFLRSFGYLTVYIISLVLALLNVCYLTFCLPDPPRTKEHKEHDNRGFVYFLKKFFNPVHFLNSLKVVFKKTADNRALKLCIFILTTFFMFGPSHGEGAILYMSVRYRFGWNEVQFSIFQAYNTILNTVGTMFCIIVVSKLLAWHDSVLGILSSTTRIGASFVYCFAATGAILYIGPAIDLFSGVGYMAIRSILSKTVESDEIGKLNSIVGVFEILMPLAFIPLYTQIYIKTLDFMPGFVFLLKTFMTLPVLLVFLWLLYKHLRAKNDSETTI